MNICEGIGSEWSEKRKGDKKAFHRYFCLSPSKHFAFVNSDLYNKKNAKRQNVSEIIHENKVFYRSCHHQLKLIKKKQKNLHIRKECLILKL